MITEAPITPQGYKDFWRELAAAHVNIGHGETTPRFVVVNEGQANPWKGVDLGELITKQRSVIKITGVSGNDTKLLMVLLEWASDMEGLHNRPQDLLQGGFLLLGKVPQSDWSKRDTVMQLAWVTGRELIAWAVRWNELNGRLITWGKVQCDPVSQITVDGLYGFRFDFDWLITRSLSYSEDNMGGLIPEKL